MSATDNHTLRQLLALCLCPAGCDLPLAEAEWNALHPLALAHGVAPLLFVHLKNRDLPNPIRARLCALYVANFFRNEKLIAEQRSIIAAFTEKSIPAWPLKGPQLSQKLYGDPAVRQVADLDLLIRPGDLAACDDALQSLSYVRQAPGDIACLRGAGELIYFRSAPDAAGSMTFAVDLQQRVLPYGRRDPLADRIRSQGLTPENLLLLLCVNQVAHRFARLKYLLDVAACLRAIPADFNWNDFTATAQLLDFTPGIYWSLTWARAADGAAVPEHVLEKLRPGWFSRRLAARAMGGDPLTLLDRGVALAGPAGAWAILACTRSGLPLLRQFFRLLLPPAAYLRQEFSAPADTPTFPLYLRRLREKLPVAFRSLR